MEITNNINNLQAAQYAIEPFDRREYYRLKVGCVGYSEVVAHYCDRQGIEMGSGIYQNFVREGITEYLSMVNICDHSVCNDRYDKTYGRGNQREN